MRSLCYLLHKLTHANILAHHARILAWAACAPGFSLWPVYAVNRGHKVTHLQSECTLICRLGGVAKQVWFADDSARVTKQYFLVQVHKNCLAKWLTKHYPKSVNFYLGTAALEQEGLTCALSARASANLESEHEELQELLARLTEENQSRQLLPTQWERK